MANRQPSRTEATNQNTGSLIGREDRPKCGQETDRSVRTVTYDPDDIDPGEDCRPRTGGRAVAMGRESADIGGSVQLATTSANRQEATQSSTQKRRAPTPLGKQAQTYDPRFASLDVNPLGTSGTQSESAINGRQIVRGQRLFYGARVGSETRNVEFKRGGGEYLRSVFRVHLRRYACAFLNSGGGSLLVGVDDDGVVRGVRCDHKQEDQARLLVDSTLKGFHPPLLPHSYTLAFIPVVRPGPEGHNLKVLRLTLRPPSALTWSGPYQTNNGDVFLRRDGSVEGPLSAGAIQEWTRQRWCGEVNRLQQCVEGLLTTQRLLLQEIRQLSQFIVALSDQPHMHLHTDTEPRPRVTKPAKQSFKDKLTQRLKEADGVMPTDEEDRSLTTPQSIALPPVPLLHPGLGPLVFTGPSQSPGLQRCPQCREKKTQVPISNICRLISPPNWFGEASCGRLEDRGPGIEVSLVAVGAPSSLVQTGGTTALLSQNGNQL
ncbi:hypothetical protein DPEC_G00283920 [Dallia pectoralis]|uniref:Uncharacterized protein n=1 Tax=Dallia pectoralis TaxID=75939 RepID=A0ACC2FJC3_DALPE|nr:hypothetical protein DPEC_G00283920 [Dallia pectoralis]